MIEVKCDQCGYEVDKKIYCSDCYEDNLKIIEELETQVSDLEDKVEGMEKTIADMVKQDPSASFTK